MNFYLTEPEVSRILCALDLAKHRCRTNADLQKDAAEPASFFRFWVNEANEYQALYDRFENRTNLKAQGLTL